VAVVAALASTTLLVTLLLWRRQDFLGVVLALVAVLLAAVAWVAGAAHRDRRDTLPPAMPSLPAPDGLYGIDADTLETFDNREALRAVRERHRGR
jgi:hypothetical protein